MMEERNFSIQNEAKKFSLELNLPNLDKRAHEPNNQIHKKEQIKRCNIRPKTFQKSSGKIRYSMTSTQRD